jgi:hypothetical protein
LKCSSRFGLPRPQASLYARVSNSLLRASLTFTSRHSFLVDSVKVHVDSLQEEAPLRKAITLLTPRAWLRCSRVLADVFVVQAETSYHPAAKLGLLNQEMTSDPVHAAIAIFELGLQGWHCLIAGMDLTAAHADLSDRLTLRASRAFCFEMLRRIGEESQCDAMTEEYLAREAFLASSRVAKVGFRRTRVPR